MRGVRGRAERRRGVVDCLPHETKLAMLDGLERYQIIAGAYSDRRGGVCPMLAAHRCGGRTDFRAFARAWDRFTGAHKRGRRASERELRTLRAQLERSVWHDELERERLIRVPVPEPERERPATRPRRARIRAKFGAWLIPVRDLDEYRRAIEAATRQLDEAAGDSPAQDRAPETLTASRS
jgi:hypothetical protein